MRIAVCGGVYSNPWALRAFIDDARGHGAEALYCLGDLGGYGAAPDAVWPLLAEADITCVAGNYDVAIASGAEDCGCGYRDPRDNHYAEIMYAYTLRHTSRAFARWMGSLPTSRREEHGGCGLHLVHGSTVGLNDFWWESLPEAEHQRRTTASGADVIVCTHSGLPWTKRFGRQLVVNVGVIGRPANNGDTRVWYALIDLADEIATAQLIPLAYDWQAHASAVSAAGLPEPFAVTSRTGWWTTCLEILPNAERARGRYHVYDSSVPTLLEVAGLPASSWPSDPSLPVCSLWGSPLMPARVWHACSAVLPLLDATASRLGWRVGELREAGTSLRRTGFLLPELTLTAEGWFYHPSELGGRPLVAPAVRPEDTISLLPAARSAATKRLLDELHQAGGLHAPAYCAA
jgi:predicted phosphodiesterase